ncbi:MAG: hypothetical protein Q4A11_02575, partial [Brachymonas sp.]|nr:hypothetical protein [Brachymonas sp.]
MALPCKAPAFYTARAAAWPSRATPHRLAGSLLFIALLWAVAPQQARADFFADNEARRAILDLRQRHLALTEENGKLLESLQTTQSQVDTLRSELARLRQRDEQLTRELAELRRAMSTASNSAEEKANSNTVADSALAAASSTAGSATEAPARTEESSSEKAAFDAALNKFRASDYAGAQAGLRTYLQKYPQGSRRIAALYWLGNSDYALRNYRNAMR